MNKKTESKFYIGIDNGVTGSIGIVGKELTYYEFMETPITFGQDYTKAKKNVSRVNVTALAEVIHTLKGYGLCVSVLERPMKIRQDLMLHVLLCVLWKRNLPYWSFMMFLICS